MLGLTALLAACGGTAVGETGHTLGTAIPPSPTATATAPPTAVLAPTSTAAGRRAGGGIVRDKNNACQLTLPSGYTVDSSGDGFDAGDGKGFGVLAGATGRGDSAAALAQSVYANFTAVFTNVQQGAVTNATDTAQIDFTGELAGHLGQDAQVPHERALPALIANLRENKEFAAVA